ncbi:MAG: RluA family pseudouridine synthase [Mariprofundaceae bacterium]
MASDDFHEGLISVDVMEEGSRLDRTLLRRVGAGKRALIMRMIRRGNVRVNSKRAKLDQRLEVGDQIFLPQCLRTGSREDARLNVPAESFSLPEMDILYEDSDILVVNKTVGIAVHGGSGHAVGVIEGLRRKMGLSELRLAHRLDRDTSGCLLMAKHLPALRQLTEAFRNRQMQKSYLAWVSGHPFPYAGRFSNRLLKGVVRSGERMIVDSKDGKEAITDYQTLLLGEYDGWPFSLLVLAPESGRTHQLRVQLQTDGHSILGDPKYAERQELRAFKTFGGSGLALHAWRLRMQHPMNKQQLDLRAPWPKRWQHCFADASRYIIES